MNEKLLIIGVSGSIRSNYKNIDILKNSVLESNTLDELIEKIDNLDIKMSNTDIATASALLGAKMNGSEIDFLSITKLFNHQNESLYENFEAYDTVDNIESIDTLSINEQELTKLLYKIKMADGIILGSPVYFGDRSSVANKFLQLTNKGKLLNGKSFGIVSVGAKRNGGQETTNIYGLYEALMQNAIVVGNGPKTAQYGGTVVAGDIHLAHKDIFGMETSLGTGRQVAQLAKILKAGESKVSKLRINIVITMDTKEHKYEKIAYEYFKKIPNLHQVNIINLIDRDIYRCVACGVCPSPSLTIKHEKDELPYNCIVQTKKDSMLELQELLIDSDCIILLGVNTQENLIYRYQAFMERTRFIRREDFELTNIPILGLLINELGSINNPIHNVKVLTSFIRHNAFILKPIELILKDSKEIFSNDFNEYISLLLSIKDGRDKVNPLEVSYKATGYQDKRLDSSLKLRK